jgi:hypothetical protein
MATSITNPTAQSGIVLICFALPPLTRRIVPMSRKRATKSAIDTGLEAFLDPRQHFPAANFKAIPSTQFLRCENNLFRLARLSCWFRTQEKCGYVNQPARMKHRDPELLALFFGVTGYSTSRFLPESASAAVSKLGAGTD